jgi:drug/metabolite transporter (DMT)-like permease
MKTITSDEKLMTAPVEQETAPATKSSDIGVVLAYVACIMIWGTTWFAVRQCVLPGAFEPFTACAWRFVIAALGIGLLFLTRIVRAPLPSKKAFIYTCICSILSVISFGFVYSAERWVSGALAAIISTTTPAVTALALFLSKTEKVSRGQIIGLVISMIGIFLIFGDRLQVSANQGEGVLFLVTSVILTSISGVILKRHTTHVNPFVSVAIFISVCAVCFVSLSCCLEGGAIFSPPPLVPALAAAYLGIVSSIISFVCYFYLLKRISLMAVSKLVFFPPIIALVVDGFFEKQVVLSITTYIGIAITLFGVASKLPGKDKES